MLSLLTEIKDKKILDKLRNVLLEDKESEELTSVTIACVIDNAEMLFGGIDISKYDEPPKYPEIYQHKTILQMCIDNKSIEEISSYILENIKE